MAGPVVTVRPALVVNQHQVSDGQLRELLLGIEEEQVPVVLHASLEKDLFTLAHQAANESTLTIGIGATGGKVVITASNLAKESPYLIYRLGYNAEADRIIGGNAARLVKRMPLKNVPDGATGFN